MDIVIVGIGKLGRLLTELLVNEKHNVTVVDINQNVVKDVINQYDVFGMCGNGACYDVLINAECQKADCLIATTSSDEVNILSCLVSKKIGIEQTIARIRNPQYSKQNDIMNQELGIGMIINPELDTANEILRILRFPTAIQVENFANGKVDLVGIKIEENSPLINKTLQEIREKYNVKVIVCSVKRDEEVIIPNGLFELKENDYVYLTGSNKEMTQFFRGLKILKDKIKNTVIIGGGKITYYLLPSLIEYGLNVKVIEKDLKMCQDLSEVAPKAFIINGEGTDHRLLEEEGIDESTSLVSLTGLDETNIIVSTYAKTLNCSKIITKVNNSNYRTILKSVGLDSVVSPKNITSSNVIRYIRGMESTKGNEFRTLYKLVDNQVEALEFYISKKTSFTQIPLKELSFKENTLIASIIRKNTVIYPTGNDTLEQFDTVIIISCSSYIKDLKDIFNNL